MSVVNAQAVGELLEHLTRRIHASSFTLGLNAAQWSALRYLMRANPSARTVTAFATFHATTRSAASQTMSALERKGLVRRRVDSEDKRRTLIEVTRKGLRRLAHDPLRPVNAALANVDTAKLYQFVEVVEVLVRATLRPPAAARAHSA